MEFDDRFNAVRAVTSPAAIEPQARANCEQIAREAIERLGAVGVFAVEFFVDENADAAHNQRLVPT